MYKRELERTGYLQHYLGLADMAHVVMMMEGGVIPEQDGKELLGTLLELYDKPILDEPLDPVCGDVYKNRESGIGHIAIGSVGWLKAGRARRDATVVAYTLHMRKLILELTDALLVTGWQIGAKAQEHQDTVMPDYTYLQQAQPTTLGHYLLGFVYPVRRIVGQLRQVHFYHNRCPGGIGSVNGSRLPVNRERLAELLGFNGVVTHTRDAMWQHDIAVHAGLATVAGLMTLSRLANDLQVWCSQEFGFVRLADEHCRASVIMPNKRNPYALTYVRKVANEAVGQLVSLCTAGLGNTGQPDTRVLCQELLPAMVQEATGAVRLMGEVVEGVKPQIANMKQAVINGDSKATDIADGDLMGESKDIPTCAEIIATRTQVGGAAPGPMEKMLDDCYYSFSGAAGESPCYRLREIDDSERELVKLVQGIVEGGNDDQSTV